MKKEKSKENSEDKFEEKTNSNKNKNQDNKPNSKIISKKDNCPFDSMFEEGMENKNIFLNNEKNIEKELFNQSSFTDGTQASENNIHSKQAKTGCVRTNNIYYNDDLKKKINNISKSLEKESSPKNIDINRVMESVGESFDVDGKFREIEDFQNFRRGQRSYRRV